jgi:hypothetical protein
MRIGRGATASKTEAVYFPPPRPSYAAAETSCFLVDGTGFVEFSESFKCLGSIIHYSLTSDAGVCKRIKSATAAFGAFKNLFNDKYQSKKAKGRENLALGLVLFALSLRSCVPSKRFVSVTSELPQPLCPQEVSNQRRPHYPPQNQFRKPLSTFGYLRSRKLLPQPSPPLSWPRRTHAHEPGAATATQWFSGAPTADWVPRDMNFGRTLKKGLKRNDLPTDFVTRSTIARDRPRWRLLTHSTPTPSLRRSALRRPTSLLPTTTPPGYGNLAPAYAVPTWYAPLTQAQYAETRVADRADRHASRANAPPQQHHLAQGIALGN